MESIWKRDGFRFSRTPKRQNSEKGPPTKLCDRTDPKSRLDCERLALNYPNRNTRVRVSPSDQTGHAMTYVVTEKCIRCKYMDCVEVCPVDCFYAGENM